MKSPFDEALRMRQFERFGRSLSDAMGSGVDASRLLAQRTRLVQNVASGERSRAFVFPAPARWSWVAAGAAVLAIALFVGLRGGSAPELTAELLGARFPQQGLSDNAWVTATEEPLVLSFSDESRIVLEVGSRARLVEVGARGARLTLESGSLEATITPGTGYRWAVQAGPHRVEVLGTVFRVDWSPEAHHLKVDVQRGKVSVGDDEDRESVRVLVAGDSLSITPPIAKLTLDRMTESAQAQLAEGTGAESTGAEDPGTEPVLPAEGAMRREFVTPRRGSRDASSERSEQPRAVASPAAQEGRDWIPLAKAGRYVDAVSAARERGFPALVETASASDLLLLADAARLGGAPAEAERVLLGLRKRFPAHPNALAAAFSLGRLAAETRQDQREAAKWFQRYLDGAPNGGLAEGARGRLLNAWLRLGERASARKAAEEYLRHHPKGPHATVARSLLDD